MADDEEGEFKFVNAEPDDELSRVYKNDPSIEHYLRLRRIYPDKEVEVAVTGGLDWLLANGQLLQDNGIDPSLVAGSLDAHPDTLSQLSLTLLAKLADRRHMMRTGKTHIASRGEGIADSLVNYLIAMMLDALSWHNELEIPRDLLVLTRFQLLGGEDTAIAKRQRAHELEHRILWIAVSILDAGQEFSARGIAKSLNINVSTVSRLYPGDTLKTRASELFEAQRSMREFSKHYRANKRGD